MKSFKTIVSLLTVAAMLLLFPGVNALQVSADEPVTYSLKYVEDKGEWRFHVGAWDDNNSGHRELYYLKESIKDGDQIVIEEGNYPLNLELPVNLKSITFNHSGNAVITAKSTENVYVLRDSVAAVNGDVVNAHVYDNAVANFNNNVTNLFITKERSGEQTIAVVGTVAYVKTSDAEKVYNEFYNFQAGSFYQEKGILKTDASKYSTTPPADTTPAQTTPATQPAADTSAAAPAASGSEYDDVPKTGESFLPYLLLMAAGVCFGSAYLLQRKGATLRRVNPR
ncbi:MAG: hypothetical protein J6B43_07640 [Lachnospiraceae bacterium]|nr:hypothetical protein [Lachnospiraceae bacterium]